MPRPAPASPSGFPPRWAWSAAVSSRGCSQRRATGLGGRLSVLAEHADDAAAQVCGDVLVGRADDLAALQRLAERSWVLTLDHEQVPGEHLAALVADGAQVHPGPEALLHAQDKAVLRERLAALGVAQPAWERLPAGDDRHRAVRAFAERHGGAVVKAVRGGYDGHGVWLPGEDGVPDLGGVPADADLLVEARADLTRELSALVARSPFGQVAAYPVVQTVQSGGVCVEVLAPAPGLSDDDADAAQGLATRLADALGVVGLLAVELFETPTGLQVNELAMRPHNSGHWTLGGAVTSQFEQHLRAVCDLPLGSPRAVAPAVACVNVFGGDDPDADLFGRLHHALAGEPRAQVQLYGKTPRPGRKLGHVTVTGDDPDDVAARARAVAHHLRTGEDR